MKRTTIATLALVLTATAACRDMGLDGNIPLDQAEARETSALVAAVMRPTEAAPGRYIVDGRLWIPSGLPLTLRAADLRSVGAGGGTTIYARNWDRAPYDALFIRMTPTAETAARAATPMEAERWIELQPVLGRSGPVPGAAADTTGHGGD